MENTLTHLVNYETKIFDQKNNLKSVAFVENTSNILRSKKAYCLKITQSINHVKEYFNMFVSTLKNIIQTHFRGMLFVPC